MVKRNRRKIPKIKPERRPVDPILRALARYRILTHAELTKFGASGIKLRRMSQAGQVISVGSGIYATTRLDPFVAAVLATAKYYPQAVISGLTALQIHGLAQEYIDKVDVDVPRDTSIHNKMLQVHRVPRSRLVGITEIKYESGKIRIYDRERALCEAYRLDPSGTLFFKALKRYVAKGKVDPDQILLYDHAAKTSVLAHLRQEIADA